jgi:hypothetical protein
MHPWAGNGDNPPLTFHGKVLDDDFMWRETVAVPYESGEIK